MEFYSLNFEEDGEHSGVGFVEISNIFATSPAFFFGAMSFDRVYAQLTICTTDHGGPSSMLL